MVGVEMKALADYQDCISIAAACLETLKADGQISESHFHQLISILNSSYYTLMIALPPGSTPIELIDSGIMLITTRVE